MKSKFEIQSKFEIPIQNPKFKIHDHAHTNYCLLVAQSHKSNLFQSYLSCRINATGSHKKQYRMYLVASGAKNIQIGRLYAFIGFYGVFYRIATYNKEFGIIPTCS